MTESVPESLMAMLPNPYAGGTESVAGSRAGHVTVKARAGVPGQVKSRCGMERVLQLWGGKCDSSVGQKVT